MQSIDDKDLLMNVLEQNVKIENIISDLLQDDSVKLL